MTDPERERPFVVIGTSGSPDYLRDTTGDQRFWPVFSGGFPRPESTIDDETCDGLHDEEAPVLLLCSRCFPDLRGDLSRSEDHGEYEHARDQEAEID